MMTSAKLALAACFLLSAVSAGAFTYDNRTNQSPEAQARFRDQQSQPNNGLRIGDSHFSLQFSGGGFGNNQPGVDSRFVPSSNPDFANPYYTQIIPDRH